MVPLILTKRLKMKALQEEPLTLNRENTSKLDHKR
jgi:hypothetical protein